MIKHIVMFKLREEAGGTGKAENALIIKEKLELLPTLIQEILEYEVGLNVKNSERSMDIVICSSFEDLDALDRYSKHPEHLKIVEYILLRSRESKVVDYETLGKCL